MEVRWLGMIFDGAITTLIAFRDKFMDLLYLPKNNCQRENISFCCIGLSKINFWSTIMVCSTQFSESRSVLWEGESYRKGKKRK